MKNSFREQLHKIIDEASDDKVQEIYNCVNNEMADSVRYSAAEIKEFNNLLELHEKGITKSYTVEETLAIVRSRKNF